MTASQHSFGIVILDSKELKSSVDLDLLQGINAASDKFCVYGIVFTESASRLRNTEKITVCYAKMRYSKNKTECPITLVGLG